MKKTDELHQEPERSRDEISWLAWLPDFRGWFRARRQSVARFYAQRRKVEHHHKEAARHRHH